MVRVFGFFFPLTQIFMQREPALLYICIGASLKASVIARRENFPPLSERRGTGPTGCTTKHLPETAGRSPELIGQRDRGPSACIFNVENARIGTYLAEMKGGMDAVDRCDVEVFTYLPRGLHKFSTYTLR